MDSMELQPGKIQATRYLIYMDKADMSAEALVELVTYAADIPILVKKCANYVLVTDSPTAYKCVVRVNKKMMIDVSKLVFK